MTPQVPLVCGLYVFPLIWATTSAVSCNGVSCLMVFIWLNFHKDTYPSPMKSEPGKLFPWTKPKAAKLWSKTVMKAHLKLERKLCLVITSWFGQSFFFMAAVQLKRRNLKDNIQCLFWLWLFLARGKGLGEILLSSTDRGDFLHLLDLARSCCFTDRGKKKANPSVVASACREALWVHPLWMEGETRSAPLASLVFVVLNAVVAHSLAQRGSWHGGWARNVIRTTSKTGRGCHGSDPGTGIRQHWRNARIVWDVGSLHLFLGNENRQRSQLKFCHPIWQRQCKTIFWHLWICRLGRYISPSLGKGWLHPALRCLSVTMVQSCQFMLDFQHEVSSGSGPLAV